MRWCDEWLLLPERLALHEPSGTAVLADAHLGYSESRVRQGDAIPCRGVMDEIAPLVLAASRRPIDRLVVAGDLFERGYDKDVYRVFMNCLERVKIELLAFVPGNHDRGIANVHGVPVFAAGYDLAGWQIVHGDQPTDAPRVIMGHWHPAVRRNRRKLPCFMARGTQLILPAFSRDASGVDLRRDERFRDFERYAIFGDDVIACSQGAIA